MSEDYDTAEFLVTITSDDPISDLYDALQSEQHIKDWIIEDVVFNVRKKKDPTPSKTSLERGNSKASEEESTEA